MKDKHFIDSHKMATGLFILLLMAYFNRWDNVTAWVYLALHGTYGLMWAFKSQVFPDKQWEAPATIWRGLYIWGGLSLYWIAPFIITSQNVQTPFPLLTLAISLNIIGTVFHFAGDMQKHTSLKLNPGHLITDGLWRFSRSPNYFGELLIYGSFVIVAQHWIPLAVLVFFVVVAWLPLMSQKDRSLSRYPEFANYKARTRKLIPFLY